MYTPNILMVDDHPENLLALHAVLGSAGYNLTDCYSGKEALGKVLENRYDVILLDVQMPEMDGFETARLIQSRLGSTHIPLIFITASCMDNASAVKGYMCGAADYVVKPFHPETLQKKVEFFLRYSEKLRNDQQLMDTKSETMKFMNLFNELVNPLWAILLNVQMMKKFSLNDHERVLKTLNQKLDFLEVSTKRLKDLIMKFRETFYDEHLEH